MPNWRARGGAATLSLLLHALLLWLVATWTVANPESLEPELDRVVVSLQQPQPVAPPPPPPAQPPPPPQAAPQPEPPPQAIIEPEAAEPAEPEPEPEPEAPEPPPEVEIPLPEQQIVAMPDAGEEKPPPDTRFLSDRDNTVEEQTVLRGEPAPSDDLEGDDVAASAPEGESDKQQMAAADRPDLPPQPANETAGDGSGDKGRPIPDLASLLPNALALARQQADAAPTPQDEAGGSPERMERRRRAAAWEPSTTLRGTLDHLPDVRAGNVTLLNTKAEVFAPFVRRVMLRVFQNLMILLRRAGPSLRPGVSEKIEAEAIMSPEGHMIGLQVSIKSTSRSIGLDRMLTEACNEAFFDRNPPPGAASADGNIHFVMQTMVQTFPAAGQGVGLSGLFGVGLL